MKTSAVLAPLAFLGAAPAQAADSIVATVDRPTTVDVYSGAAVWSAWDPAKRAYRLTASSGGKTTVLPVEPSRIPFDVDLGPGSNNGLIAVYSRCSRRRQGCDLYAYRFTTRRESRLTYANSPAADERWPTVWGGRLAFARTYRSGRQALYWRSLTGAGSSHRLRTGPSSPEGPSVDEELDMRGRRVAFVRRGEFGGSLRLTRVGGGADVLVRIPGSGAAARQLTAQGPAIGGRKVGWGLVAAGDQTFTEIRRVTIATHREQRAPIRIDAATTGFGYFGLMVWYVKPVAGAYEVHQATVLDYEPAPPPRLGAIR